MGIQERREREREARKKSVLDAARALVRDRGFNGATSREIAKACEISEATLFFYYKSKDEIFTSLLLDGIDFMARGLDEIAAAGLPRRGRIERLWRFFGEVRAEHPEYFHVFAYLAHPQATAWVSDEVKSDLARRSGDNFRRFAALLRDGGGGPEARMAADLVWSAFVGLHLLRDSRENLGATPHPTDRELGAALDLLLDGVAPATERGGER
ncbi:MAG: TetR/AcrR family transcriptional regulator [Deltaproteobacteria bacterium]|nr:TetR/AcrR family transcriptional regulator [Deltaproteobacteria bacterium]